MIKGNFRFEADHDHFTWIWNIFLSSVKYFFLCGLCVGTLNNQNLIITFWTLGDPWSQARMIVKLKINDGIGLTINNNTEQWEFYCLFTLCKWLSHEYLLAMWQFQWVSSHWLNHVNFFFSVKYCLLESLTSVLLW